jgi:phosphohistidine phosphatase
MGRWLRKAGHVPDQVLCSTARRARETWKLAEPALKAAPPVSFEDRIYLASAGELLDLVRQAPRAAKTLLIVGHDPGIPDLAFLLTGPASPAGGDAGSGIAPPAALERMKAKFPTAAIAVLELTGTWRQLGPGAARLASFVIPREVSTGKSASR